MYMRKCGSPCHDDVIIRLGDDDVIVNLDNAVTCCLNDVILTWGLTFSHVHAAAVLLAIQSLSVYIVTLLADASH